MFHAFSPNDLKKKINWILYIYILACIAQKTGRLGQPILKAILNPVSRVTKIVNAQAPESSSQIVDFFSFPRGYRQAAESSSQIVDFLSFPRGYRQVAESVSSFSLYHPRVYFYTGMRQNQAAKSLISCRLQGSVGRC